MGISGTVSLCAATWHLVARLIVRIAQVVAATTMAQRARHVLISQTQSSARTFVQVVSFQTVSARRLAVICRAGQTNMEMDATAMFHASTVCHRMTTLIMTNGQISLASAQSARVADVDARLEKR